MSLLIILIANLFRLF